MLLCITDETGQFQKNGFSQLKTSFQLNRSAANKESFGTSEQVKAERSILVSMRATPVLKQSNACSLLLFT